MTDNAASHNSLGGPVPGASSPAAPGDSAAELKQELEELEEERHASNLELFLDLVFVFAVTQVATRIHDDLTVAGVLKALLIWALVWWQWSQFTWIGAAVNLQSGPVTRVLVLATIPATLIVAVSIPAVFDETGMWFAGANLVVQLLVLGMQGAASLGNERTRGPFLRYASLAVIAPLVVIAGASVDGSARVALWVVAMAINVLSAIRGAAGDGEEEWMLNPVHFAERHALFVIISLGESLVTIGAVASGAGPTEGAGLTARVMLGIVAAAATACVLWWTYFAFIPHVTEAELRRAVGAERGRLARDLFTFGHVPIVVGLVFFAAAIRDAVAHPTDPMIGAERLLLALAIALVVGGYLGLQWRAVRWLSWERLAAIAVVGLACALAARPPAAALLAGVALTLAAMQAVTWRRFRRGGLAHLTPNR